MGSRCIKERTEENWEATDFLHNPNKCASVIFLVLHSTFFDFFVIIDHLYGYPAPLDLQCDFNS